MSVLYKLSLTLDSYLLSIRLCDQALFESVHINTEGSGIVIFLVNLHMSPGFGTATCTKLRVHYSNCI